MGAVGAVRDVIVVGLGPGGAAAAALLRAPGAFGLSGRSLDVLALEARAAVPTRGRVISLDDPPSGVLRGADELLRRLRREASPTAPEGVATIARVERTLRDAYAASGGEARYGARIVGVDEAGRAGVAVRLADGSTERGRWLVDASGARIGAFRHGHPSGETIYLTGQLPALDSPFPFFARGPLRVHGAGQDRTSASVFGFSDAREGATAFVEYPSLPRRASDARAAHRLLRRHLLDAGFDPRGLRDVAFVRTPHVRVPQPVQGAMLAVGDTVRRVTPRSARGVANALHDARAAARAIHAVEDAGISPHRALGAFASDVASR